MARLTLFDRLRRSATSTKLIEKGPASSNATILELPLGMPPPQGPAASETCARSSRFTNSPAEPNRSDLPTVTVVMPIRNEERYIATSLGSVLAQDYPKNRIEIIVADGMSTDGTRQIVGALQAANANLRLIDNPKGIAPTALNAAIATSRGDIIVRVDGHCEIDPDYVRRCVEALDRTGADNVGGVQRAVGSGAMSRAIALATSSAFGVGNARFHYATEPGWVDTVFLGAYKRDVFDRIGRFDEELVRNQDDELNFRLQQAGGRIWLDPSIKCVYRNRSSLKSLWRQYYLYGVYKVRVIQKRQAVPSWRHLVPASLVLGTVGTLTLGIAAGQPLIAGSVLTTYSIAAALACLLQCRGDLVSAPLVLSAYGTMHFAYGLGFLTGLFRWRKHWRHPAVSPEHAR